MDGPFTTMLAALDRIMNSSSSDPLPRRDVRRAVDDPCACLDGPPDARPACLNEALESRTWDIGPKGTGVLPVYCCTARSPAAVPSGLRVPIIASWDSDLWTAGAAVLPLPVLPLTVLLTPRVMSDPVCSTRSSWAVDMPRKPPNRLGA